MTFKQEWLQIIRQSLNKLFISKLDKGIANGVATLDSTSKLPETQLPTYITAIITARQGLLNELNSANPALLPNEFFIVLDDGNRLYVGGEFYVKQSEFLDLEARVTALEGL